MPENVSRKDFVALVGTAVAAETIPASTAGAATAPHKPPAAKSLGSEPEAYTFLTEPESAFVEAAVERLIPPDELGPGGREAGVAFYIDQQLSGQFGYAAKMYRQGPWVADATPDFGYQLPLTPQQVYRLGIAATNAYCEKTYGKTFDKLDRAHQDDVLTALDGAKLSFDAVPAKTFFEMLYGNTVEGFFADPLYGGNRDKAGWKLIGFPGAAAAYYPFIEKHNVPYKVAPQSIADLQQAEQTAMSGMDMDAHVALAKKALGVK
ncbi:MAG TPA: gluconate 2-dehydrogenase subunit 3 family protein [Candidatus Lustribacter sp.]|jgi:gluconate 2-dehydrogenase gamma chain|nr:gluconate 2-dehydrogenase subunit 3 family protein [Candidatus Lustribacter sp.]